MMTPKFLSHLQGGALWTYVAVAAIAGAITLSTVRTTTACDGAAHRSNDAAATDSASRPLLSKAELQVVGTHVSPNVSAQFTADGKWIVTSGSDGVAIHDADSTACVNWLNGELGEVAPDGLSLLLRHPNGAAELRSIPDGKLIWRLPHEFSIGPLHFSDDGQYIVWGFQALLRVETREVVHRERPSYRYVWWADQPNHHADGSPASPSIVPPVYRGTLRHDGRPLVTPRSGLCSPAGRFMILITGEVEDSYAPLYSVVERQTERRLFSNIASPDVLLFHDDDYVYHDGAVYQTDDGKSLFSLAPGITSFALSAHESLLAVGWGDGQVAVVNALTGAEAFRVRVEKAIDTDRQQSGEVVSLAFSKDGAALAAVGRKLTLVDIATHAVSAATDLGPGIQSVGKPETTPQAHVAFNADGSRLLLTAERSEEYNHAWAKAVVFRSTGLEQLRALSSDDFSRRLGATEPARFSPDGAWAMAPNGRRGSQVGPLQLWDTEAAEPIPEVPRGLDWYYRSGKFDVPDFPKRHIGLGRDPRWHANEVVMYPWWRDYFKPGEAITIPDGAQDWLDSMVRVNPQKTYRLSNGMSLYFPAKQWVLRFGAYDWIQELHDLSTGVILSPALELPKDRQAYARGTNGLPKTCWGLSHVKGVAFSPDGSLLLVSCSDRNAFYGEVLASFEMPSGKLIRSYEGRSRVEEICISPNNRIAAIATDFHRETWIIDLESGETVVDLPEGGNCSFSPDSRYAHIGDRSGSRWLLSIETGDLVDFERTHSWSFSPNSRYAVREAGSESYFVELATGVKTEIPGYIQRDGLQFWVTGRRCFPLQGRRLLSVDGPETTLFDIDAAEPLARFNLQEFAAAAAGGDAGASKSLAPTGRAPLLYAPDDRHFVVAMQGLSVSGDAPAGGGSNIAIARTTRYSTQVVVGDLETGRELKCSMPTWGRSPHQHALCTRDGARLITISGDKMVCWKLHPPEPAWEADLSGRWTDPETGAKLDAEASLRWSVDYAIHPSDRSILIAADGREAILFSLETGEEEQRFGPLPIHSVLRFGGDGEYLQVGFRANRSMRLYNVSSGEPVKSYHFVQEGAKLYCFGPCD